MNVKSDISVESMLEIVFGAAGKDALGFEEEDLTPEEKEVIDGPDDEEEGADEVELAEECERLCGQILTSEVLLRTAEEFVWAKEVEQSTEAEADEKKQNVFKKFWEWLKKIFEQIKTYVVTAFKRIQVWIAGDMKNISKFAKENSDKLKDITKSDVELTIKIPQKSFSSLADTKAMLKECDKLASNAIKKIDKGEGDETLVGKLKELSSKITVKSLTEDIYGSEAKKKVVTIEQFDKIFSIASGISESGMKDVKESLKGMQERIKTLKDSVKTAQKKAKGDVSKENASGVKELASAAQKALNTSATSGYWIANLHISLVRTAYKFARKAIKESGKGNKDK